MPNKNWNNFFEATKNRKPVDYLVDIVKKGEVSGLALDLGCGAGVDAKYLAENGFKVIAVDNNIDAINKTKKVCEGLDVEVIESNITNFKIEPEKYSLIIAWNTLPFLKKEETKQILKNIKKGLKKDGLFVFYILGEKDGWSNKKNMSFWNLDEFEKFMKGAQFVELYEKRKQEPAATGQSKFWNSIRGVIKK
ncbi:MAG: class I SAM-dependent methyltransferase [Lutibacter sp.]|jgi:cyclopropane fatty-acyl-phospholipid synthase-like methyltransferase